MEENKLITTTHESVIKDHIKFSEKSIKIISPFISFQSLDFIKSTKAEITIITRFSLEDFAKGSSSIDCLSELLENENVKIFAIKDLHTKLYIFDDNMAILGSANFTDGGLNKNIELSVETKNQNLVKLLNKYFNNLLIEAEKYPILKNKIDETKKEISLFESKQKIEYPKENYGGIVKNEKTLDLDIKPQSGIETSKQPIYRDAEEAYISQINRIPTLTPEEEDELLRNIYEHQGTEGDFARKILINANLSLVVSIAKKFQTQHLSLLDLIQEGNIGLSKAVEKYDHEKGKGKRFSAYAQIWIRQAIERAIDDKETQIRMPVHVAEKIKKYNSVVDKLRKDLLREPTKEEVAAKMKMSVDKFVELAQKSHGLIPIEKYNIEILNDNQIEAINDMDEIERELEIELLREDIVDVICTLSPKERDILRLRYGMDDGRKRSLEDVGKLFGVTRERIRQIEAKAFRKLRHPNRSKQLRNYIDKIS